MEGPSGKDSRGSAGIGRALRPLVVHGLVFGAALQMDSYDRWTVRAFLAEYLGRGPENPVR